MLPMLLSIVTEVEDGVMVYADWGDKTLEWGMTCSLLLGQM